MPKHDRKFMSNIDKQRVDDDSGTRIFHSYTFSEFHGGSQNVGVCDRISIPRRFSTFVVKLDPDPQGSRGAAGMIYSEIDGKYQNFVSIFWLDFSPE